MVFHCQILLVFCQYVLLDSPMRPCAKADVFVYYKIYKIHTVSNPSE